MFRSFKHQINRFHYLGKFGIQWCLKGGIVYTYIYSIYLSYICSFLYKVSSEIEIKTYMNCLIYFLFRETKASCIKTLDSFWAEQLKSQRGRSETRESLLLPIKVLLWLLYITTYTKLDLRYCFSGQTVFFSILTGRQEMVGQLPTIFWLIIQPKDGSQEHSILTLLTQGPTFNLGAIL